MSTERVIGIDFGTSTSVMRVKRYKDGKPCGERLAADSVVFNGSFPTVPTLVQKVPGGNTYYGFDAQVGKRNAILCQNFKVDLESADAGKKAQAQYLIKEFLAYLCSVYKSQSEGGHLGDANDKVRTLISYPVKWSDESKAFMVQAAVEAGFANVEGIDEAQAAIHAATLQSEDYLKSRGYLKPGVPCTILLVDMGAGTTDLALCRYTPGAVSHTDVLATWPKEGEVSFGGQEVEDILQEYVKGKLSEDKADTILKRCGREKFKIWKETVVSPALEEGNTVESFADIDLIAELLEVDVEPYGLNAETFEKYAEEYLRKFPALVNGCLESAGIDGGEVELVLLTGGHSQWYFVKEMLAGRKPEICGNLLPRIKEDRGRIIPISRPHETVALGLVYQPISAEIVITEKRKSEFAERATVDDKSEKAVAAEEKCERKAGKHIRKDRVSILNKGDRAFRIAMLDADKNIHLIAFAYDKKRGVSMTLDIANDWDKAVAFGNICPRFCDGIREKFLLGQWDMGKCDENSQKWADVVSWNGEYGESGGKPLVSSIPFGLRRDGTVITPKLMPNDKGGYTRRDNLIEELSTSWRNIEAIDYCNGWLFGWKADDTLLAMKYNQFEDNVTHFDFGQMADVGISQEKIVTLAKDGIVRITGSQMVYSDGRWRDIVAISCSPQHGVIAGLRKDGRIAVDGCDEEVQKIVEGWENIISLRVGKFGIIGLQNDGVVQATGLYKSLTESWDSVVAIYNYEHLCTVNYDICVVGIRRDGTVICSCAFTTGVISTSFKTQKDYMLDWKLW